jgi:predicted nucleic acid-binding protein
MSTMQIRHSHLILDACCILNFCASSRFIDILESIAAQSVVTEVVSSNELLTLKSTEGNDNEGAIQLRNAIDKKLLIVSDFESDQEAETFVNYAAILDDGESASGAIALHRNWAIATDDRKATNFFRKEIPQIQILSTLEILQNWAENSSLGLSEMHVILTAIRTKARYQPKKSHPQFGWWNRIINAED